MPVDPVKTRQIGRSEPEEDPFYGLEIQDDPDVAACPELDRGIEKDHRGEGREKKARNRAAGSPRSAGSALGRPGHRPGCQEPSGAVFGGPGGRSNSALSAIPLPAEKFIQIAEVELWRRGGWDG